MTKHRSTPVLLALLLAACQQQTSPTRQAVQQPAAPSASKALPTPLAYVQQITAAYLINNQDSLSAARRLADGHELQYDDVSGSYVFNPEPGYFQAVQFYVATEQDPTHGDRGLNLDLLPETQLTLSQLESVFGAYQADIQSGAMVYFVKFAAFTQPDFAFTGALRAELTSDATNPEARVKHLTLIRQAKPAVATGA